MDSFFRTSLNTCGRSRTWQMVHRPSRASATATPFRPLAVVSKILSTPRSISATSFWRSALVLSMTACRLDISVSRAVRSAAISFSAALSSASLFLTPRVELVGFQHDLEDAIFARADVVLRGLDLVEHRGVFAVGLHLEQLILVFREPCLNRRRPPSLPPAASRRQPPAGP